MKKMVLSFLLCVTAPLAFCQSAKIENIKKLLELTGSGKIGEQVAHAMIASFQQNYADVPNEYWESVKNEIHGDDIVKLVIPIYDKYYSEEDISQLIDFYQSPLGKKVVSATPLIMHESMKAGDEWGKSIGQKVVEKLKHDGYIKEN